MFPRYSSSSSFRSLFISNAGSLYSFSSSSSLFVSTGAGVVSLFEIGLLVSTWRGAVVSTGSNSISTGLESSYVSVSSVCSETAFSTGSVFVSLLFFTWYSAGDSCLSDNVSESLFSSFSLFRLGKDGRKALRTTSIVPLVKNTPISIPVTSNIRISPEAPTWEQIHWLTLYPCNPPG